MAQQANPLHTGHWSHDLCGCFDNIGVCIITYFVPCVTFGMTREKLTGEGCVLYGCLFTIPLVNIILESKQRGEIRSRRGIPGSGFGDCCTICWCTLCTLVQEEQEAIALQQQQAGGIVVPAGAVVVTGTMPDPQYAPQPGGPAPQYAQQYPPQQQYPAENYEVKGQDINRA